MKSTDSFSGKFDYLDEKGTAVQAGVCRLNIDDTALRVIPEKGQPLALDLGGIDVFSPGDCELSLKLYTGKTIALHHFAKAFQDMCNALKEAYRGRLLQCLLLEDLEEIERFEGFVQIDSTDGNFSSPAQFRLYRSNIAVLPERAPGMHWRLSDIDSMEFDEESYRLELRSGNERLVITKLAKRTSEFTERLRSAMEDVSENSSRTLQGVFPFLSPDQFQVLAGLMKEGHSTPVSKIAAVHPEIVPVLMKNAVDDGLRPYVDILMNRKAGECDFYAGFKMVRPESESEISGEGLGNVSAGENQNPAQAADSEIIEKSAAGFKHEEDRQEQALHWFFFPILSKPGSGMPADVVAWEAASHTGRATYFFRIDPDEKRTAVDIVDWTVRRLNRALVMINFRREPVYLPDDSLLSQALYRHYAIAVRRLPVLRELRASYIGRAVHTTTEAWQKQMDAILARV